MENRNFTIVSKVVAPIKILGLAILWCLPLALYAQAPTITSFSPTSGPIGTSVTITGTNFDTTPANNVVFFGATQATVSSASTTTLDVVVPAGATHAPITVLNTATNKIAYSSKPFRATYTAGESGLNSIREGSLTITAGGNPPALVVGDLDADGYTDMVVASKNDKKLLSFINLADGTVGVPKSLTTTGKPLVLALGDLDNDGLLDLVLGDSQKKLYAYENNFSSNNFKAPGTNFGNSSSNTKLLAIKIVDMDGDGWSDVIAISEGSMDVYRNNGATTAFSFTIGTSVTGTLASLDIGDLNGDGKPDVAVSGSDVSGIFAKVYTNNSSSGTISFNSSVVTIATLPTTSADAAFGIALEDFDNDADLDAALLYNKTGTKTGVLEVYENNGSNSFSASHTSADITTSAASTETNPHLSQLFKGDVNGDGYLDLIMTKPLPGDTDVLVFENTADGTIGFNTADAYTVGGGPSWVAVGDLNNDGKRELAVTDISPSEISIFKGSSTGTDITSFTIPTEQAGETTILGNTISLEVLNGTFTTSLAPEFTLSDGASAYVGTITDVNKQISGSSTQDFVNAPNNTITYTIVAEDGGTANWDVTVTEAALSTENDILEFSLPIQSASAEILAASYTINVKILPGQNLSSVTPGLFTMSEGATLVGTSTTRDFSSGQATYTIKSQSGVDQVWTVNVLVESVSITTIGGGADGLINSSEVISDLTISGTTANVYDLSTPQTVILNVKSADGTVTHYTSTSSDGGTVQSDGSWSITFSASSNPLGSLSEGDYLLTADVGTALQATRQITIDKTAEISITSTGGGDDYINASEASDINGVVINGTTTSVDQGQIVTITLYDLDGTTELYTSTDLDGGTVNGSGDWSVTLPQLSVPGSEGTYAMIANGTDKAGNTAQSLPKVVIVDTTAPTVTFSVPVGDELKLFTDDLINKRGVPKLGPNGIDESATTVQLQFSELLHNSSISADIVSTADIQYTPSNDFRDANTSTQTIFEVRLQSSFRDTSPENHGTVGTVFLEAGSFQDIAGNPNTASASFEMTNDFDATPTFSVEGGIMNSTGTYETNAATVTINITFPDFNNPNTSELFLIPFDGFTGFTLNNATIVDYTKQSGWTEGSSNNAFMTVRPTQDGTVTINFSGDTFSDDVWNNNEALDFSFISDRTAPEIFINTVATDDIIDISEAASDLTITGTTDISEEGRGVVVKLTSLDGSFEYYTNEVIVDNSGGWEATIMTSTIQGLDDGDYMVTADITDQAGNEAFVARTITKTTTQLISIGTIAGDDVINSSEAGSGLTISGSTANVYNAGTPQTVNVTLTPAGGTTIDLGSGSINSGGSWSITILATEVQNLADGEYTFIATVAGSAVQNSRPVTVDKTATINISTIAGDDMISASEAAGGVSIEGTTSDVENGQTVTVTLNGNTYTNTVSNGTWSVTVPDVTALSDGPYTVTARVSDVAGNSAEAERNIVVDLIILNTETDITAFSFSEQTGQAIIDAANHTVSVEVSIGTDVSALIATFALSEGATATVDGAAQVSGTTSNDFTNPVTYTITTEDGSTTQDWVVTVTTEITLNTETDITAFSFSEETGQAIIDAANHTVSVEVSIGTDVSALIATFALSEGATATVGGAAQVSGTTSNDFTNPVTYTITAEDGSTSQGWTVTVTTPVILGIENPENRITVYPNPVSSILNIQWNKFWSATLHDLSGNEILRTVQPQLDLSPLHGGVYILVVEGVKGESIKTRIIKK